MEILPTVNNNPDEALKNGRFGGRNGTHYGIDLKGEIGDPVYAMYSGTVIYNINKYDSNVPYDDYEKLYGRDGKKGYAAGNRVQIRYDVPPPPPPDQDTIIMNPPPPPEVPEQIYVKYFHLDRTNIIGTEGRVNAGDIIGFLGKTGSASSSKSAAPHLHLEVRVKSNYKSLHLEDPEKYLYTLFRSDGVPYRDCE